MKNLLTITQAAKILNVHPDTLRRWEKAGKISTIRISSRSHRRYRNSDIFNIIQNRIGEETLHSPSLDKLIQKLMQKSQVEAKNHNLAKKLIQIFISGWKQQNLHKITLPLSSNCALINSQGQIVSGIKTIQSYTKKQFRKVKVKDWNIASFYYSQNTAIFEWVKTIIINRSEQKIEGVTVIQFSNNKISHIREYRQDLQ